MNLRTGIDLVEIHRLSELPPEIRTRFVRRVFTENEVAECGDREASLMGFFAAKEAVAKALGTGIGPVSWKEIEIYKGAQGEPLLTLHGKAQEYADQLGLSQWSISISHNRTQAVAVAVAIGAPVVTP